MVVFWIVLGVIWLIAFMICYMGVLYANDPTPRMHWVFRVLIVLGVPTLICAILWLLFWMMMAGIRAGLS